MTKDSQTEKTLTERWKEHSDGSKDSLRAKLIDAVSAHDGWEEGAISIVDTAVMPVIRQHEAEQPQDVFKAILDAIKPCFTVSKEAGGDGRTIAYVYSIADVAEKAAQAAMRSHESPVIDEELKALWIESALASMLGVIGYRRADEEYYFGKGDVWRMRKAIQEATKDLPTPKLEPCTQ